MDVSKLLFWSSSLLVVYPYLIYPVFVKLLNVIIGKPVRRSAYQPTVTVIIPAYNEADCIEATVKNKLSQDYPAEKLDIIVVSDESTDGTDEIVEKYTKDNKVQLIRQIPRRGKASGLNMAIKQAGGEIIIFSDANSIFGEDTISKIVENYSDPTVGYVTGNLTYVIEKDGFTEQGSDAYMKYENLLRKLETEFGSVIGVNGGVDSIRKELYVDIPQDQITDLVLPLHVIDQGKRVVFDERAKSYETPNKDASADFRMRVRVALRGLRGLVYMKRLFNPLKFSKVSFSLVSHKVIRYLTPCFMIISLLANFMLYDQPLYAFFLYVQLAFYAVAIAGIMGISINGFNIIIKVCSYFVLSNFAFLIAIFKFFKGESMATWKPRGG